MNILYLSCHGALEFDEVKLLSELGYDVFCHGDIGGNERPLTKGRDNRCNWMTIDEINTVRSCSPDNLPDFVIEKADVIICMHVCHWLINQWDKIRKKKCFLRQIGQHSSVLGSTIRHMTDDGLKVIPYWPNDLEFNGLTQNQVTQVVPFYKDDKEFFGWKGTRKLVLTACNDITREGGACRPDLYKYITGGLPRLLVGRHNRLFGDFTARVPYDMLKELYRECFIYFYIGTEPATYTLNLIEAMMTGMPVIAFNNKRGIKDMVNFCSDDPDELFESLQDALSKDVDSPELTKYCCREKAIELFSRQRSADAWKQVIG